MGKMQRVQNAAIAADPPWEFDAGPDDHTIKLWRGDETIQINWDPATGALLHPLTYTLRGVREVKLRNVSAAIKQMADKPDYKARGRASRVASEPTEEIERILPFDIAEATDEDIIKAVRGKRLVWWNTMLAQYETGTVPDRYQVLVSDPSKPGQKKRVWRTSRNISMSTSSAGRRILTFPAVGEQFRSVGLDSLVQVQ